MMSFEGGGGGLVEYILEGGWWEDASGRRLGLPVCFG